MLQIGVIGIGNCGNQIAKLAHTEAGCDAFAINTSEKDLSTLPSDIPRMVVGETEGTGKDRDVAKQSLKMSVSTLTREESFREFVSGKDVILVISSAGGGSGSGMAPIMVEIGKEAFRNQDGSSKIVILVGVLPKLSEGESTQLNAMQYLHEVYDVMDNPTYMLFDNNKLSNLTSYKVLEEVNRDIVRVIEIMQCKFNYATPYDSIDDTDMRVLLSTPGLLFIAGLYGLKEKDLDGVTIEDKLIETIKSNSQVELQRDGVVAKTGIITNLEERLNEKFDTHIESVRQFVGEPTEEFLHTVVNSDRGMPNNVFIILAGLSKTSDRIAKIEDRIEEIEEEQNAKAAKVEGPSIDPTMIDRLNAKRGSIKKDQQISDDNSKVGLVGIFDKFNI